MKNFSQFNFKKATKQLNINKNSHDYTLTYNYCFYFLCQNRVRVHSKTHIFILFFITILS